MKARCTSFYPLAESLTRLFYPYVEVIFHNLVEGKIEKIFNNFSKRKEGESSELSKEVQIEAENETIYGPYLKTNWDGRKIRSVTYILRDEKQKPFAFMCMNFDISPFERLRCDLDTFLQAPEMHTILPETLFKDSWQEKIQLSIRQFLHEKQWTKENLKQEQRRALITFLYKQGAFQAKHAAQFIGHLLDVSRATIYQDLSAIKNEE